MLAETTVRIIKDFCQFIEGEDCSHWSVGFTGQSEQHLFKDEKIAPDSRWYIYRRAGNAVEAYAIAKAFWNIECQKSPHSLEILEDSAVFVFAYRRDALMKDPIVVSEVRPQRAPLNINNLSA